MRVSPIATRLVALLLVTALITGCAGRSATEEDEFEGVAEQQLYDEARDALDGGRYTTAISRLEAIDTRYPFGRHAEQAQLELIYAYYETQDWEAARAAASRFIRLHPTHPQADYALYMRGLASWQAGRFSLERLRLIDISKRDLGASRDAYNDFRELVSATPPANMPRMPSSASSTCVTSWPAMSCMWPTSTCARAPTWPPSSAAAG
jgi:outer membrane protein assembly factor BamD